MRAELRRLFSRAIAAAFPDAPAEVALVPCANPKFGDYQCNNAMAIFGKLKGSPGAPKNPRAVAQAILDALDAPSIDLIDETSCALSSPMHAAEPVPALRPASWLPATPNTTRLQTCWHEVKPLQRASDASPRALLCDRTRRQTSMHAAADITDAQVIDQCRIPTPP